MRFAESPLCAAQFDPALNVLRLNFGGVPEYFYRFIVAAQRDQKITLIKPVPHAVRLLFHRSPVLVERLVRQPKFLENAALAVQGPAVFWFEIQGMIVGFQRLSVALQVPQDLPLPGPAIGLSRVVSGGLLDHRERLVELP